MLDRCTFKQFVLIDMIFVGSVTVVVFIPTVESGKHFGYIYILRYKDRCFLRHDDRAIDIFHNRDVARTTLGHISKFDHNVNQFP